MNELLMTYLVIPFLQVFFIFVLCYGPAVAWKLAIRYGRRAWRSVRGV